MRGFRAKAVAAATAIGVVLGMAGGAFADNLQSDAGTTTGVTTITAGDSTTITYRLVGNNAPQGDASGCNASASNPVTVTITRPSGVTGSPASLSFTGCGNANTKTATFSAASAGSYLITHSLGGGVSGSRFNNDADFTLTVNAPTPTNTSPSLDLPADITVEATSSAGAAVSYSASASDTEDGVLTATCVPSSGSTFSLGLTQVDCSATDSNNVTTTGMFNVIVRDTTAPSLSLPSNITEEATSAAGASVTYSATATDLVDGSTAVTCLPPSGSTFALGTATVNCSSTDARTNQATGSFTVTVRDTTAPSIGGTPSNMTLEATGPGGAAASWTAPTASDAVDGNVSVTCSPLSGSTFALGTTKVTCSAQDVAGNAGSAQFDVTVQDTTPPVLTLPSNITKEATGPSGASATWTASATDLVDGSVSPICLPASGSTFALGTTSVHCSAQDTAGNLASGNFTVKVQDTTAPSISGMPSNQTVVATGVTGGAAVSWTAPTASDLVDGSVTVVCSPVSGTIFALGTTTVTCSATDVAGNKATASFTVSVRYDWTGFFQPVDNLPTLNKAKAGSAIPIKFSLAGNQGLNIFASSYPTSLTIACGSTATADTVEETLTAGGSSLKYDADADQYIYVWKTQNSYAGTCRTFSLKLVDGTVHQANFYFVK